MQTKILDEKLQVKPKLDRGYSKGSYNNITDDIQTIRLSEGCPNHCEYCAESYQNGSKPIYYNIPEIVKNQVKINDMNLIYKPKALEIIKELGTKKVNNKVVYYELICGIDYRFMTQDLADALKQSRFIKIRLAWDHAFNEQKRIKNVVQMLLKAGYRPNDITIFMVCNWKIPYIDNLRKLDLCKVWNVKVADCWFDAQTAPNIKPIHWDIDQIKDFRRKVRKHNQLVNFKIDPECT